MLSPCYIVFWSLMARIAGCIQYLDLLVNHYHYIQNWFIPKTDIFTLYALSGYIVYKFQKHLRGRWTLKMTLTFQGIGLNIVIPPPYFDPQYHVQWHERLFFLLTITHLAHTDFFCPSAMFFIKRCTVSLGMKLVSSAWKLVPTLWPGQISMLFPAAWPQLNGNALPVYTYTAYFCTPECLMAMYYQF